MKLFRIGKDKKERKGSAFKEKKKESIFDDKEDKDEMFEEKKKEYD